MARSAGSHELVALGHAVRGRRLALGYTQERLAEESGLHERYISDVERGRRNIGFLNLIRLAEALQVDLSAFAAKVEEDLGRATSTAGGVEQRALTEA
jgi:transcriptional regulator with XRE-family HTH domain